MKSNQYVMGAVALLTVLRVSAQTPVMGRFVRVEIPKDKATLSLAEVQIFSKGVNVALKGKAMQSADANGGVASRAIDGTPTPRGAATPSPTRRRTSPIRGGRWISTPKCRSSSSWSGTASRRSSACATHRL